MKEFARLYSKLDETTKTTAKVDALASFFSTASPADAAWALFFLSGRKPRQPLPTRRLRQWAQEIAGLPAWLFDESYRHVGDLAETIALLLPPNQRTTEETLDTWIQSRLLPLRSANEEVQRAMVMDAWGALDSREILVWNKLITGAFRIGVSQVLVVRALSQVSGVATDILTHRLMGAWEPTADFYNSLLSPDSADADRGRPYPFYLASPLDDSELPLGSILDWQAEWKWDGIRAQLIHRTDEVYLWSRGEELVTDRYPELALLGSQLPPGTVLDGEILPWKDGALLPFADLQKRIGRKSVPQKLLRDIPVALMTYDLLEHRGIDQRDRPLVERRRLLEELCQHLASDRLLLSPVIHAHSWEDLTLERTTSRQRRVEGVMLKRKESPYRVGRVRGDWWKWKIEPYSIDAVLIYAQQGHGRRSGLFTDYTFGVWDGEALVPFAKAYSGLTDQEIKKVDAFVRTHTLEKFGPVRTIPPKLVFEIGFEGIQRSARHRSGVAVRFPRMLRWRTDKSPQDANSLDDVRRLLDREPG
jgi:DNA ligase-1